MSNKVELNNLTQVVHNESNFLSALNENLKRLQQAINDTLSRTGKTPNQMEQVLDMNGKRIVNIGKGIDDTDAATVKDIKDMLTRVDSAIARLSSLTIEARQALQVYATEYIYPVAQAAVDQAEAARDQANVYKEQAGDYAEDAREQAEGIYNSVKPLLDNLDALLHLLEITFATAQDVKAGTRADMIVSPKALKDAGIIPTLSDYIVVAPTEWDASTKKATVTSEMFKSGANIIVSPNPTLSNIKAYGEALVYATRVMDGALELACEKVPTTTITVNIGVF